MQPITEAAQALAGLLRAAEERGLPMPFDVTATNYEVSLIIDSLDDLSDWSTWLNSPIDDTCADSDGRIHYRVYGTVGPVPLRVTALAPIAEVAS